ncbi:MAG TPA: hypothetical protein VHG08_24410 [Longimicrobium sp.]|nr:hypothetical protein [Longimicrobium sp.]
MHSARRTFAALAAALALGACERSAPEQDAPAAAAPQQQAPAAAAPDSAAAPALPPAGSAPATARRANPEPTREDSIAAAKEDVTPEWKQRERSMDSYANCMEQARAVTGPARQQLEKACGNLPSAPR